MKPTTLIFDINGVLFKENKLKLIKKIGLKKIIHYLARHRSNPIAKCLNTLQAIHEREPLHNEAPPIIYKQRTMPQCTADWQRGLLSNQEVISSLSANLAELCKDGYFASTQEFKLISHIVHTTLDIKYLKSLSKPMKRTIRLVQRLRTKGNYKLFILSNMGHEPFELLKQTYPDVFSLFDDCIVSAEAHYLKPDPLIFDFLCKKHFLTPQECIFIDDQEENVVAAQQLGMHGILFDKTPHVRTHLKKLGIL